MRIAHLSDFHVFASAEAPELIRPDIAKAVEKIVADVAAFRPQIDACMITGDLAGYALPEDYALLRELLKPLSMPLFVIPGNHDAREPFRAAFNDMLPFEEGPFLQYETAFRGLRILGLDTIIEDRPEGMLCPERLAWVQRKLETPFNGTTLILMHHAPYLCGVRFLDEIGLVEGKDEFGKMIAAMQGRARILCGHIHRPSVTTWQGAFAMVGGSPAFTIELDFSGSDEEPALEQDAPYAYFIHSLDASGEFAVSPRFVRI